MKVGDLFQKEGVEVKIVSLPEKLDPDLILQEKGPEEWQKMLDQTSDYLTFLVGHLSKSINIESPAGKNELVQTIAKRIRSWDHPLMIHESLRKLARLTQTPDAILGAPEERVPQTFVKRSASVTFTEIDPDRILEADLLRWLLLMGETSPELIKMAQLNLKPDHFRSSVGRALYEKYMASAQEGAPKDLLSLAATFSRRSFTKKGK